MSEAVTMPSLKMMTSTVSKESLARDTQTDRQTDTHTHTVYVKFVKVRLKIKMCEIPVKHAST